MCLHTRSLCDESVDSNFSGEDEVTSLVFRDFWNQIVYGPIRVD
jgi:hypothetical protein